MLVNCVEVRGIIHASTAEILGNRLEDVIFLTVFISTLMQGPDFSTEICVYIIEGNCMLNGMEYAKEIK
jgi:hypothetical protein